MASTASRESYAEATEKLDRGRPPRPRPRSSPRSPTRSCRWPGCCAAEPRLRRALTDPSRSGDDRAELLRSLLAGKLGDGHGRAARDAGRPAAGRAPSELLDATERLGVDAVLRRAERAGELAEVEDELFRFGQVVSGDSELAVTLSDPGASTERRVKLVEDLLKGKAQPATVRLVELALEGFGGRSFEASLTRLVELAAAKRDRAGRLRHGRRAARPTPRSSGWAPSCPSCTAGRSP